MSSLEHELHSLLNWTSRSEHSKCHISMAQWLTVKEVLVTDLNVHVLVKLVKLLDWDLHVLVVPLGVLATVNANLGSPLLLLANGDPDDGVHLVEWATSLDIEMSAQEVKSHNTLLWNDKSTHGWLHYNLWLRLHNHLWLRLNNDLGLHHLWLGLHDDLWLGWLNHNSGLLLGADIGNLLLMEHGAHHDVTSWSALVHKLNALMDWAARRKESKGHVGMA